MKNKTAKVMTQGIEDIERAVWYARLAFGAFPEFDNQVPAAPEKCEPVFNVMP